MNRFTYFDKRLQKYALKKDINKDDLVQILGELEDSEEFKDNYKFKTFAEYLINFRKQKGLSQIELSELAKIPRSSIAKYETNKSLPSLNTLYSLVSYAGVPDEEARAIYRCYILGFDDGRLNKYLERQNALFYIEFGKLIACERKYNNLSKRELAERLGVSTHTITKFESGETKLNIIMRKGLANVLKSSRIREINRKLYEREKPAYAKY